MYMYTHKCAAVGAQRISNGSRASASGLHRACIGFGVCVSASHFDMASS